jgi:subtilase family serine protease
MRTFKYILLLAILLQVEHVFSNSVNNPWKFVSYEAKGENSSEYKLTLTSNGPVYQSLISDKMIKPPTLHDVTGITLLHTLTKLDGSGIKIGVIDSSLDYTHGTFA